MTVQQVAQENEGILLATETVPSYPVASYLKFIRRLELNSIDYLIIIAPSEVWVPLQLYLITQRGLDRQKIVICSKDQPEQVEPI
ncbi:hypothetical protein [Enterococcus camelliae]